MDGRVGIDELIRGVSIALGSFSLARCPSLDIDANGRVSISELIAAVNNALRACGGG
jgi:hypothetical protein